MSRFKKLLGFFLSLIFLGGTAQAQIWTEHLAGTDIEAIIWDKQQHRRLLWFVTDGDGVISFDGTNFTDLNTITTNGELVTDELTTGVMDYDGDLWLGTSNAGLIRFKPDSLKWKTYTPNDGLLPGFITSLAVDIDGAIWIGTNGRGVNRFDRVARWDTLTFEDGLCSDDIAAIAIDQDGNKWFGAVPIGESQPGGVSKLNTNGTLDACLLKGESITAIYIDTFAGRSDKWFTTISEVFLLTGDGNPQTIPNPPDIFGFNHIAADEDGHIWFGYVLGAARLDLSEPTSMWKKFEDVLSSRSIQTMALDEEGNLWFGASNGQGAVKMNGNWLTFTRDDGLRSNTVTALAEDSSGTIWAGTLRGLSKRNSTRWQTFFGNRVITDIEVDAESNLWLGTSGNGVIYLKQDTPFTDTTIYLPSDFTQNPDSDFINDLALSGDYVWIATEGGLCRLNRTSNILEKCFMASELTLIDHRVKTIAIQNETSIWLGTQNGGNRFNPISNEWERFTTGLSVNWITDILIDENSDTLWFATNGAGVILYYNGQWQKTFTMKDGLADDLVLEMVQSFDPRGIWFATRNGVSFLNANGNWTTFRTQHGLGGNLVNTMLRDLRGDLWFGTRLNGVTRYKHKKNRPVTQLLNRFDVITNPEVVYKFIGSDHGTPTELLRYSYKLDSREFSPYTFDAFARVTIPSNDVHTFYVKTIDTDGNESSEATDTFYKIDPDTGIATTFVDSSKLYLPGNVSLKLYWPPRQLPDTTQITIQPVSPDSLEIPAVLAYEIKPFSLDIQRKGVILSFAVPKRLIQENENYSIHLDQPNNKILGGTVTIEPDTIKITTSIDQLGRYALRVGTPLNQELRKIVKGSVNAQPRIFSPQGGGGHGTETTLSFYLAEPTHVRIRVYNLAGRLVDTICDRSLSAGVNAVDWNGRDQDDQFCPSGLYILTIESRVLNATKKVMVLNQYKP